MNQVRRARNRRGEGERLRSEIIGAAAGLVEETGGREAVTLRGVARRAGVTAPSIYAHFATVEEILEAVVIGTFTAMVDYAKAEVEPYDDPGSRLRALCRAYLDFGLSRPNQYRLVFARDDHGVGAQLSSTGNPLEAAHAGEAFAMLRDMVRDCVRAQGTGRDEDDMDESVTLLWVGLHGYTSLRLARPGFPWPSDERMIDLLVERLLRAG